MLETFNTIQLKTYNLRLLCLTKVVSPTIIKIHEQFKKVIVFLKKHTALSKLLQRLHKKEIQDLNRNLGSFIKKG